MSTPRMNRSLRRRQNSTHVPGTKDDYSQRDSSSSSDDDVCFLGEVSSKREESSSERDNHVLGCSYLHTNTCLCKDIISFESRRAKLSSFRCDSSHSSILAGRFVDVQSTSSSETSFCSAQTNQANDKDKSSTSSSNYSTDKWNKNIQDTSREKNNHQSENSSSTSTENKDETTTTTTTDHHGASSTTENNQDEPTPTAPINSSFIQKLKKVIEAPAQLDQESTRSSGFFKRLSQSYIGNADNFRRKLLTIMEDVSMNQDISDGELENLANEFVGICQYIQDESMPSMMLGNSITSPLSTSHSPRKISNNNNNTEKVQIISDDSNYFSPLCSPVKKMKSHQIAGTSSSPLYRAALSKVTTPKTPRLQPEPSKVPSTPGTPGVDSFIRWEKYCEQNTTPGSDVKEKTNLRRSLSVPDFVVWSERDKLMKKCQDQERSLDDSVIEEVNIPPEDVPNASYETFDSHDCLEQSSSGLEYHSLSSSILDDEDDLTRTIMLEVAKKRQRCYETEKTIREIDAASNTSRETSANSESNKILEMFEFIKKSEDYDKYLTAHGKTIREATKRLSKRNLNSHKQSPPECQLKPIKAITPRPRSPLHSGTLGSVTRRRVNGKPPPSHITITATTPVSSCSTTNKIINSPRRVPPPGALSSAKKPVSSPCLSAKTPQTSSVKKTPVVKISPFTPAGKTNVNVAQSPLCNTQEKTPVTTKRRFFPTPNKANPSRGASPLAKPRQPKTYFTGLDEAYGYKHVRSPVGDYIRGTDTQLVQNVRAKRNSFLLTPKSNAADTPVVEDLKFKLTPVNFSSISSPILQHQAMKIMAENEENIPDNDFHLPQTNYEMPAEVHEIIGSASKIRGARSRLLQEANERKVVTRHEGRVIPSPVDSLDSDNAEMSIHITNLATKTNYVGYLRREKVLK